MLFDKTIYKNTFLIIIPLKLIKKHLEKTSSFILNVHLITFALIKLKFFPEFDFSIGNNTLKQYLGIYPFHSNNTVFSVGPAS